MNWWRAGYLYSMTGNLPLEIIKDDYPPILPIHPDDVEEVTEVTEVIAGTEAGTSCNEKA